MPTTSRMLRSVSPTPGSPSRKPDEREIEQRDYCTQDDSNARRRLIKSSDIQEAPHGRSGDHVDHKVDTTVFALAHRFSSTRKRVSTASLGGIGCSVLPDKTKSPQKIFLKKK
jgi:hypothetical protein